MQNIGIIDYGSGNIFSLLKAFQHLGFRTEVSSNPTKITDFSHLVIPGLAPLVAPWSFCALAGSLIQSMTQLERYSDFGNLCWNANLV